MVNKRQYNKHIFNKIIFFKYRTREIKTTETNNLLNWNDNSTKKVKHQYIYRDIIGYHKGYKKVNNRSKQLKDLLSQIYFWVLKNKW